MAMRVTCGTSRPDGNQLVRAGEHLARRAAHEHMQRRRARRCGPTFCAISSMRVADEHDGVAALLVIGADLGKQLLAPARVKSRASARRASAPPAPWRSRPRWPTRRFCPPESSKGDFSQQALVQSREAGGLTHAAVQLRRRSGPCCVGPKAMSLVDGLLKELVLRILEHQPHAEAHAADLLRVGPDVLAVEQHAAARRLEQAVEVLDQRRFAAARVPDEAEKLAVVNVERQIVPPRCGWKGVPSP